MNMLSSHRIPPSIMSGYNGQPGMKSPPRHIMSDRVNFTNEHAGSFNERTGIIRPGLLSERKGFTNDRSIFASEKSNFANDRTKFATSQSFTNDRPRTSSSEGPSLLNDRPNMPGLPTERSSLNQRMTSPNERQNLASDRQSYPSNGYVDRHNTPNGRSYAHEDRSVAVTPERSSLSIERPIVDNNSMQIPNVQGDSAIIHNDHDRKSKSPRNVHISSERQPIHPSFNKTSIFRGEIFAGPIHTKPHAGGPHAESREYTERYIGQRNTHPRPVSPKHHMEHGSIPRTFSDNSPNSRYMYHIPQSRQENNSANSSESPTQRYNTYSMISTNSNNRPIMVQTTSVYGNEQQPNNGTEHFDNHRFDPSIWKNYTAFDKSEDYRTTSFASKGVHPGASVGQEKRAIYTQSSIPFSHSENIQSHNTILRDRALTSHRQNSSPYTNIAGYPTFLEPASTPGRNIHDRLSDRESSQQNVGFSSSSRMSDIPPEKYELSNGNSIDRSIDTHPMFPSKRARFSPPNRQPNSSDHAIPMARQSSYNFETRSPRKMLASPEGDNRQLSTDNQAYLNVDRTLQDRASILPDRQPPMLFRNNSSSPDVHPVSAGNSPQPISPQPISPVPVRNNPTTSETQCTMSEIQPLYPRCTDAPTNTLEIQNVSNSQSPSNVVQNSDPAVVQLLQERSSILRDSQSFSEDKSKKLHDLHDTLSSEVSQVEHSSYFLEKHDDLESSLSQSEKARDHSLSPLEGCESSKSPLPAVLILNTEAGSDDSDCTDDNDNNNGAGEGVGEGGDNNDDADHEDDGHVDDDPHDGDDDDHDDDDEDHDFDDYDGSTGETIEYGNEDTFIDENNNNVNEDDSVHPYDRPLLLHERPSMLADSPSTLGGMSESLLMTTESLPLSSPTSNRPSIFTESPSMVSVIPKRPSVLSDSPSMVLVTCERPPMLTDSPSMVSAISVRPSLVSSDTNGEENMMESIPGSDKSCVVKRGKRKKYQKYTPADRIAIGKFCFEHGPAAARKAFQSRYPEMSESVTRGFRDKYKLMIGEYAVYCFEQKRRREMQVRNESLPRGRPRKYKQMDMSSDKPSTISPNTNSPPSSISSVPSTNVYILTSTVSSSPADLSVSTMSSSDNVPSSVSDLTIRVSSESRSVSPHHTIHHSSLESRPTRHDDVVDDDVTMVDGRPQFLKEEYSREEMLTIGWFCAKHGGDIALNVFSEEHPDLTYEKVVTFHKFYLESEGHGTQGDHGNVFVVQPESTPVPSSPNGSTSHPGDTDQIQRSLRNESKESRLVEATDDRKSSERELDSTSRSEDVSSNNSEVTSAVSPPMLVTRDLSRDMITHPISPHPISPIIHYPKISSESSLRVQQPQLEQRQFKQEEYAHAPKLEPNCDSMGYPYDRSLYMYGHENLSNGSSVLPRTKRFKYQKYSPEDRFNIGKLCNDIGLGATVKVYREQFPRLNESVVRTFRNKYRELLQKGNGVPVAEAIQRKPSRRSITTLIEGDVVSQLRQLKQSNIDITEKLVIAVAENIIATKDQKEIGPVKNTVTKEWASSLLWKHKLVERQISNPNGVCCERCKTPLVCPKC